MKIQTFSYARGSIVLCFSVFSDSVSEFSRCLKLHSFSFHVTVQFTPYLTSPHLPPLTLLRCLRRFLADFKSHFFPVLYWFLHCLYFSVYKLVSKSLIDTSDTIKGPWHNPWPLRYLFLFLSQARKCLETKNYLLCLSICLLFYGLLLSTRRLLILLILQYTPWSVYEIRPSISSEEVPSLWITPEHKVPCRLHFSSLLRLSCRSLFRVFVFHLISDQTYL